MNGTSRPAIDERLYGREDDHDVELWKHHASFGGEDKNRMVAIASWFLGFSAAILWYVAVQLIAPDEWELRHPLRSALVSVLGIGISLAAGYISILYGGYSNRNWKKADDIAELREWKDLCPSGADPVVPRGMFNRWAWRWAKPCEPEKALAPVFKVFLALAVFSCVAHVTILGWSLASLR